MRLIKEHLKRIFRPQQKRSDALEWTLHPSFESAVAGAQGYDVPELLQLKIKQAEEQRISFRKMASGRSIPGSRQILQNLLIFERAHITGINSVYEVGGAAGNWFFVMNALLQNKFPQWIIREQPSLVKAIYFAGKPVSAGLTFTHERTSPGSFDSSNTLYFAQGVLQYLADPLAELNWAFACAFPLIYLCRTPVLCSAERAPVFAVQRHFLTQHAPGFVENDSSSKIVSIPLTLFPLDALVDLMPATYEIDIIIEETEPKALPVSGTKVFSNDVGIVFKKK